jgi:hypothetical protein
MISGANRGAPRDQAAPVAPLFANSGSGTSRVDESRSHSPLVDPCWLDSSRDGSRSPYRRQLLEMRRIEDRDAVYVYGRFLDVCVPQKLIYTWEWENAFEQMPETQVTVSFIESGGGTEMELVHEPLPET